MSAGPHVSRSRVKLVGCGVAVALVVAACAGLVVLVREGREVSHASQCQDKLKQLGLAVLIYHDEHGMVPAVTVDHSGRPMHSWRAVVFKEIERSVHLQTYRLEEPWNSPHNLRVNERNAALSCPTSRREGFANYVAITGPDTLWPGSTNPPADALAKNPDTIMIVEIADSDTRVFEPRDVTLDEFVDHLVRHRPHAHGFTYVTAGYRVGKFEIPRMSDREALRKHLIETLRPMVTIER